MGSGAALVVPREQDVGWPVTVSEKGQWLSDEEGENGFIVRGNLIASASEPNGICGLSYFWRQGRFHEHLVCSD